MNSATGLVIEFQGFAEGAEMLGGIQANFSIDREHHAAKEVSVLLNDPAAAKLASLLGGEDTPEFRHEAAREVGRLWVESRLAARAELESITVISAATLGQHPELIEGMRASLGRLAPQRTSDEPAATH